MDYYGLLRSARDDGNENVDDLDPLTAYRVALLIERVWSEHGERSVTVESAVRTYDEQKHLYDGWRARKPGFNLAANPDRIIGFYNGVAYRGSWHMGQPARGGHGFAVDLTRPGGRIPWSEVHRHLPGFGLRLTVPGEPWHVQALVGGRYIDGPQLPTQEPPRWEPPAPELPDLSTLYALLGGTDEVLINDHENDWNALLYYRKGVLHVRPYGTYRGEGVPAPGSKFVYEEQARRKRIVLLDTNGDVAKV